MQDENIILYFKGEITDKLLSSILQIIEDKMEREPSKAKIKKRVFSILLECLQNIYNYVHYEKFDNEFFQSAMLIITQVDTGYHIISGNYISNHEVDTLKQKIERVNMLSTNELKELYKEVLSTQDITKQGGAGLGIIDMARKSGEKIEFSFEPFNESLQFFSLQIKVLP